MLAPVTTFWPLMLEVVDDSDNALAGSTIRVHFTRGLISPLNFNSVRRSRKVSITPAFADEYQPCTRPLIFI